MDTTELDYRPSREASGIKCQCGGFCDLVNSTTDECKRYGCGRDTPGFECCAVAFVCCLCGQRYVGKREAPEYRDD